MDEELFKKGLEKRKATLGKNYVEKNLEQADEFTLPFQKAMTEWCWGFGWGDEVIDMKTRSMMNLSMIGALGKMHEWEIHCRGAITNGVTKEEIRALISSLVTPLVIAPLQCISHSCILPSAPIIDKFIIERVFISMTSSPHPKPQHHSVIAF